MVRQNPCCRPELDGNHPALDGKWMLLRQPESLASGLPITEAGKPNGTSVVRLFSLHLLDSFGCLSSHVSSKVILSQCLRQLLYVCVLVSGQLWPEFQ